MAVRTLLKCSILEMLPDLFSFQSNVFVPRRQAAEGVYIIKRILEVCTEWAAACTSLQCIAVVGAMLSQCELAVRLGHVITDPIKLHRGLPQCARGSSMLCCSLLVCELVLRPLLFRCQTEGRGWFFCDWDMLMTFWFSAETKTTRRH